MKLKEILILLSYVHVKNCFITKVGKKKYSKLIILGIEQNCFILRFMSLPIVILVDRQLEPLSSIHYVFLLRLCIILVNTIFQHHVWRSHAQIWFLNWNLEVNFREFILFKLVFDHCVSLRIEYMFEFGCWRITSIVYLCVMVQFAKMKMMHTWRTYCFI